MGRWKSYGSVLILLSITIGIILNPIMPNIMASHWNFKNQIDGYLPKFWVLFGVPILMIFFVVLFSFLVKLDPLIKDRSEKEKMASYYDKFIFLFTTFLFYIYMVSIVVNLDIVYKWGLPINVGQFVLPALGVLFFFLGLLIKNIPLNWFAGIRTPWTLSSPEIWQKTHFVGGILSMVFGVIISCSFMWPDIAMWIFLASIFPVILVPIGYSLYLFLVKK